MNHRPTSRYTEYAANLSKQVCEAFALLLNCNSAIEDAMIVATGNDEVASLAKAEGDAATNLRRAIDQLERSIERVRQVLLAYDLMLAPVQKSGYKGNRLAARLSEFQLLESFSGRIILPSIQLDIWNEVARRVERDNVIRTFEWERSLFQQLETPTSELAELLRECWELAAKQGGLAFVGAVDCNGIPLRQYFAKVFSLWLYVLTEFFYRALISTELYYRSHAIGTLGMIPEIPAPEPVPAGP